MKLLITLLEEKLYQMKTSKRRIKRKIMIPNFKMEGKVMEENRVENVINIIKDMEIKDKLRLGICLSTSDWVNILYNRTKMYERFDIMLKEVDEEYRTILINFTKYKLVMFTMAKIMEMEEIERNRIVLYWFNSVDV